MKKNLIVKTLLATILATNILAIGSNVSAAQIKKRVRLGGKNRFETAVEISKEFERGDKIENVLICSNMAWADAMSSSPLSAYKNAPILLTEKNKLTPETKQRLKEMRSVKNIIILGGEGIISNKVFLELKAMKFNVERIGGKDRYETNLKMMNKIPNNIYGPKPKIVNGMDFNQVLSLALDAKMPQPDGTIFINPIFLVQPNATKEHIELIASKLKDSSKYWNDSYQGAFFPSLDKYILNHICNDNYNIFAQLENILGGSIVAIENSYGKENKFACNAYINSFYNDVINLPKDIIKYKEDGALLVNGETFADSLSVSALSAKRHMPIVFANRNIESVLEITTDEEIKYNFTNLFKYTESAYYIGGTAVMPDGRECILNGQNK